LLKKVTIKSIEVTGDPSCSHCQQAKAKVPGMAAKVGAKFKFNNLQSQKGLEVAKKHVDKAGNVDIPIIIVKKEKCSKTACLIDEKTFTGFNEKRIKRELGL
jgi:hypothetical protein